MQTLALALALVAVGSGSWANSLGSNLNLSKSNVSRIVYEKNIVSLKQAREILKKLDQFKGARVEEVKVREILQSCGVRAVMKKIIWRAAKKKGDLPTYIVLTDPEKNEAEAIAISDAGMPSDKETN